MALTSGIAAVLVLLSGCATGQHAGHHTGQAGGAEPATGDGFGQATSGEGGSPTAQPPPPPPASPPAATYPTTARAYAEATVAAWSAGDLSRLSALTTPEVDEQFIEIPGKLAPDWIHYRCDGVAGSNYCTLRNGVGDSVTLRVTNQYLGKPHAVVALTASLTTYPANGEMYAREFVRAWATGNTPRMRALARPAVVVAVNNAYQDRPQGTWALGVNGEHGGAGLLIVDVDINEGAITFTLEVGTTLLGTRHAIVGYEP
jgi:hypothetical protein